MLLCQAKRVRIRDTTAEVLSILTEWCRCELNNEPLVESVSDRSPGPRSDVVRLIDK